MALAARGRVRPSAGRVMRGAEREYTWAVNKRGLLSPHSRALLGLAWGNRPRPSRPADEQLDAGTQGRSTTRGDTWGRSSGVHVGLLVALQASWEVLKPKLQVVRLLLSLLRLVNKRHVAALVSWSEFLPFNMAAQQAAVYPAERLAALNGSSITGKAGNNATSGECSLRGSMASAEEASSLSSGRAGRPRTRRRMPCRRRAGRQSAKLLLRCHVPCWGLADAPLLALVHVLLLASSVERRRLETVALPKAAGPSLHRSAAQPLGHSATRASLTAATTAGEVSIAPRPLKIAAP